MANPDGTPIWYELTTADPAAAKRFYDAVVGWSIDAEAPLPGMEYRMIHAGDGHAGGVMTLTAEMKAEGAQPGWLFYVGVADVDGRAEQARSLGGQVLVPPTDIPGVGRFALLLDPQGAPFYIMRGDSEEDSRAFSPSAAGHCSWNELGTSDADAALGFYRSLFGWENRETMDMGPLGGYHFLDLGETRLGALCRADDRQPRWNFYFRVPSIAAAKERVETAGGTVTVGPHEVPGGDVILIGTDPEGATFSLVGAA